MGIMKLIFRFSRSLTNFKSGGWKINKLNHFNLSDVTHEKVVKEMTKVKLKSLFD